LEGRAAGVEIDIMEKVDRQEVRARQSGAAHDQKGDARSAKLERGFCARMRADCAPVHKAARRLS
jgi:hypothetical protein